MRVWSGSSSRVHWQNEETKYSYHTSPRIKQEKGEIQWPCELMSVEYNGKMCASILQ